MTYLILKYRIEYQDKSVREGFVPFRSENCNEESRNAFIEGYFAGAKDIDVIKTEIAQTFETAESWLLEVRHTEEFKYLQRVNNFAGDLTIE